MTGEGSAETTRLAAFCAALTYDSLDESTVEATKKAFVDTLGASDESASIHIDVGSTYPADPGAA